MDDCFICDRIKLIKENDNPYFVKEFSTGFAVIGDNQYYRGLTLFLAKDHVGELHELSKEKRDRFLSEMADVAASVYRAFHPRKINYELLGNKDMHAHWWIIPRYIDDPEPGMPIWVRDKSEIFGEATKPSSEELKQLVATLRGELI